MPDGPSAEHHCRYDPRQRFALLLRAADPPPGARADRRPLRLRRSPLPHRPPAPRGPRGRARRALRAPQARARLTLTSVRRSRVAVMGNSSAFGSLARKALAWAIVAVVAILLFKFILAAVARILQMFFGLILLALVAFAVIWAVRRL